MIVGAQKAGTTALATFLGNQPGIAMSTKKECHIFDQPGSEEFSIDDINERYAPFFQAARNDQLWGEATPIYLYFPWIARILSRYNPELKIIVILRDPVERALSQYRMEHGRDAEKLPLFLALLAEPFRLFFSRCLEADSSHRCHSYRSRGLYSRQIRNLHQHFRPSQVIVISQSDLLHRHDERLKEVCLFLGIEDDVTMNADIMFSAGPLKARGISARLLRLSYWLEYRRLRLALPRIVASWAK